MGRPRSTGEPLQLLAGSGPCHTLELRDQLPVLVRGPVARRVIARSLYQLGLGFDLGVIVLSRERVRDSQRSRSENGHQVRLRRGLGVGRSLHQLGLGFDVGVIVLQGRWG